MSETLTQFGTSFQSKIIASLLGDVKFIQTISDILNPSMFDSDSNKWLVKTVKDYYYEYKKQPTLEVIKYKIDEIDNDVLKSGVVDKLRDVWKNIEATDLEFVQTETLDFCKNQTLKSAILDSVDLLENKDYDGIKSIIDEAMKAGTTRDLGHDYIISLEQRLEESARITVKTPWDVINDIMDGGLGAGELIGECVLAIDNGLKVKDLANSIHPHPTLSETLMECAESFYGEATHIYKRGKKQQSV